MMMKMYFILILFIIWLFLITVQHPNGTNRTVLLRLRCASARLSLGCLMNHDSRQLKFVAAITANTKNAFYFAKLIKFTNKWLPRNLRRIPKFQLNQFNEFFISNVHIICSSCYMALLFSFYYIQCEIINRNMKILVNWVIIPVRR